MHQESFDVHNTSVQMLMVVHIQQLQRTSLSSLTYTDLEDYLNDFLWKRDCPHTLHEAADDVLHVTANDLVRFMSKQAVTQGASGNLADFADLIGGLK